MSSSGPEVVECAELAGLFLDPWQKFQLTGALGERADGKWSSPTVGLIVARQNGKGSILEARELGGLFVIGERLIIHSAHEQATASEQFRRLLDLIDGVPDFTRRVKKVSKGKGSEAIELFSGQRIFFKTRTSGGGRGFTADCLIYDEAMVLPDDFVAAVSPTLAARSLATPTGVQTWYTGSAVDKTTNEHGMAFSRVRRRGIAKDERVSLCEWSADLGDDPGKLTLKQVSDPHHWAVGNPALGFRIGGEYVANEIGELGVRKFAVERLSVGDWPDPEEDAEREISVRAWAERGDADAMIAGKGVLAFSVARDGSRASIGAGGRTAAGTPVVRMVTSDVGTRWLPHELAELVREYKPTAVLCNPSGASATLLPDVEKIGVDVQLVSAKEWAQACGMLANAVREDAVRHPNDPEVIGAIADAATRPLAGAWAWDGRGASDMSPLDVVTLALWGVEANTVRAPRITNLSALVAEIKAERDATAGQDPTVQTAERPKVTFHAF